MNKKEVKLGIIGAMPVEVETLISRMQNISSATIAGSLFYEGILESLPTVITQCCAGKVNAAICAQILCSSYDVTHLINTGIAGSLSPELVLGDLVISQDVIYHDFDLSKIDPGFQVGQVPIPDLYMPSFPADEGLISLALEAAETIHPGHVRPGRIATGDQFICTQIQRNKIIADTQALCAEMEGAAIAHTAYRNGIPFVILRVISDQSDENAKTDYPTFERISAHRCAEITAAVARKLYFSIVP